MPFSDTVRFELCLETGGYCANPDCQVLTGPFMPSSAKAVADAAHIVAEKINGPRGQSTLTPEERAMASNGVWLCPSCHRKVDVVSPQDYSIECLQYWKATAKEWWKKNQGLGLQIAAFPNRREQVARPSASAINGANNFLKFHEPLVRKLHNLKWQLPMPFERGIIIPEEVESLISMKSTSQGIAWSWKNEWSTNYHCDDKEFLDYMRELIRSVDLLRRPLEKYEQRRVQFDPQDDFAQRINNYIDVWERFQKCLVKHENWGL